MNKSRTVFARRLKLFFFSLAPAAILFCIVELSAIMYLKYRASIAFTSIKQRGEYILKNDGINFMKEAHDIYGYKLKSNLDTGSIFVNNEGFFQRDSVPLKRDKDLLRIATLGGSTTMGHNVDSGNYPVHLKQIIEKTEKRKIEIINGGVAGFTSTQAALLAEHELALYLPDIVILYIGWNDFQTYDAISLPPKISYFDYAFGTQNPDGGILFWTSSHSLGQGEDSLKSVFLARAFLEKRGILKKLVPNSIQKGKSKLLYDGMFGGKVEDTYKFYIENIDRIIKAFRSKNPDTKIVLSTLVGWWDQMPKSTFNSNSGAPFWMKKHGLGLVEAQNSLDRFNNLIRKISNERDILLIDAASEFKSKNKKQIMMQEDGYADFVHMFGDGYQDLAKFIHISLKKKGLL